MAQLLQANTPSLDQIAQDPATAGGLSVEAARALLARCLIVQNALIVSALSTTVPAHTSATDEVERLLLPAEAASMFGVKVRWLLEHADDIPGTRRLSRKVIRFSQRGLRRFLGGVRA